MCKVSCSSFSPVGGSGTKSGVERFVRHSPKGQEPGFSSKCGAGGALRGNFRQKPIHTGFSPSGCPLDAARG